MCLGFGEKRKQPMKLGNGGEMSKIRQESRADKSGGLERGGEEIRSGAVRAGRWRGEEGWEGGAHYISSLYQFYYCVFVQKRLQLINVQETLVYKLPQFTLYLFIATSFPTLSLQPAPPPHPHVHNVSSLSFGRRLESLCDWCWPVSEAGERELQKRKSGPGRGTSTGH